MTVHPLHPSARRSRRFLRTAAIAALVVVSLIVCMALALVLFGQQDALLAAHHRIKAATPWLALFQLAAIAALWLAWPWLVDRLPTRWPEVARAALLAARHRICVGLLLVELVVVFGVPFNLL